MCSKEICVVLFKRDESDFETVKDLAKKYSQDGLVFLWTVLESGFRTKLLEVSPCESGRSEECVLAAIRYSGSGRDRLAWAPAPSPLEKGSVGLFLDRVVGGDVQWTRATLPDQ
jgi:hypothetical protein